MAFEAESASLFVFHVLSHVLALFELSSMVGGEAAIEITVKQGFQAFDSHAFSRLGCPHLTFHMLSGRVCSIHPAFTPSLSAQTPDQVFLVLLCSSVFVTPRFGGVGMTSNKAMTRVA
jgi:hypothetical protein